MARRGTQTSAGRQSAFVRNRAVPESLPAPIGGWNARDALGEMPPADAVSLINMFPSPTDCVVRSGFSKFATGIPGQVETLMQYSGGSTLKLFAVGANNIYDVTAGGAVGAAKVSALANSRWQYTNISTTGGSYIECCNGADGVYTFDGTTWVNQSGSITGVTAANLIHINLHKNRLWFIEKGTLKAWYLPVESITGAANALDLSAFATRGGQLMAMATWTIDGGYGMDDLAVFITSNGEVIVYRGTDPSSATTWALVGVYWIGSPVGRRCFVKYRGDVLVICHDGLVPLSGALQSSRLNPRVALTDKIQYAMSAAVTTYNGNFGWQVIPFPMQNMLLMNVPIETGNLQEQYVMSTITGAWCDFQGWNANCFELFNDFLYFGGNGYVGKAWDTNADAGTAITGHGFQAFNYFGSHGQLKRFTMMRPVLLTNGTPSIQGFMNIDFDLSEPASALSTASISGATWDAATWDTSLWADTNIVSRNWQGLYGVGYAGALHFNFSTNGVILRWVSTDVVMEPGGIL